MTTYIRPTVSSDLAAIAAIYAHYVLQTTITFEEIPPSVEDWQNKLAANELSGWPFLTATDEDEAVLGYAYLAPFRGKSGWRFTAENSIYLSDGARGLGLGTELLDALEVAGAAAGVRSIVAVITDEGTDASRALHAKAGYVESGYLQNVGWKFERPLGVYFQVKHLTPAV